MATKELDPTNEKDLDRAAHAVVKEEEESREDAELVEARRLAAGFAPSMDPGDPRFREEREAVAREAMGIKPETYAPRKKLGGSRTVRALSSAEEVARTEQLRSGRGQYNETREVTVHGTRYLVPTGRDAKVPDAVADILEQADNPIRTTQMKNSGDGVPTVDLRNQD